MENGISTSTTLSDLGALHFSAADHRERSSFPSSIARSLPEARLYWADPEVK